MRPLPRPFPFVAGALDVFAVLPDAALRASGSRTDLYYVLSAGLLWGTGGLAGSLLGQLAALPPLAVATYRLAGGGLTVLAVLRGDRRLPRLRRAGWLRVLSSARADRDLPGLLLRRGGDDVARGGHRDRHRAAPGVGAHRRGRR